VCIILASVLFLWWLVFRFLMECWTRHCEKTRADKSIFRQ
jgi:hypothetical protein